MRKIVAIALCCTLLAGCTKEATDPLIGTWSVVEIARTFLESGKIKIDPRPSITLFEFVDGGVGYINGSSAFRYKSKGKYLTLTFTTPYRVSVYEIREITPTTLRLAITTESEEILYTMVRME